MVKDKATIVFLYSELAQYTIACFKQLVQDFEVDLHVVKWPVNKEAPFDFSGDQHISFYNRENFKDKHGLLEQVKKLAPKIIVISGWMDKDYLFCVEKLPQVTSILTMDNQWKGSLKQQIAVKLAPYFITKKFNFIWVPGSKQKLYALKMGFENKQILEGFYAADISVFNAYYQETFNKKKENFPRRFLFVGRYVKHKGIYELWDAFIRFCSKTDDPWELWCVGTGEEFENRVNHPQIKHFGFLQPSELKRVVGDAGIFVLPSYFEPWGVVVQEFAASGFPIICSKNVGATDRFLEHGKNGYIFNMENSGALVGAFDYMSRLSTEQLIEMGQLSHSLAQEITPVVWSKTIMRILEHKESVHVRN